MTDYRLAWLKMIETRDAAYLLMFLAAATGLFWYKWLARRCDGDVLFNLYLYGGGALVALAVVWGYAQTGG